MSNFDEKKVEKILHYGFKNKDLLRQAFTHSSYANEHNVKSNERLEFLGDSVLSFIVAEDLYNTFNVEEGQMSKWRAKMVNSDNLASIIESLELDKFLLVGKSAKGVISKSMKEDLYESIVGAIYIDNNSMDKARRFVFRYISSITTSKKKDLDYKTTLQEEVQKEKGAGLVYFTYEDPDDKEIFVAEVYINDIFVARSKGASKKEAQMDCARLALEDKQKLREVIQNK